MWELESQKVVWRGAYSPLWFKRVTKTAELVALDSTHIQIHIQCGRAFKIFVHEINEILNSFWISNKQPTILVF